MIKRHDPIHEPPAALHRSQAAPINISGLAMLALVASSACALAEPARARVASAAPVASASCALSGAASGHVTSVVDGRTFVLADGREVRLAAIEVAPVHLPPGAATRPQPDPVDMSRNSAGEAARQALALLISGREVLLKHAAVAAQPTDRYGRLVAFGFVKEGVAERSLQHALLARGHARLATRVEPRGCLSALRAHEDAARRAALGLWSDPLYSVRDAAKPADILPHRGRFAVVGGEVVSVRESGGTIYVNFSRRWSDGFSAFILKRNAGSIAAAGLDLQRLEGRRVEVRGFVEQRRGPGIAVERPEQIAIVEGR